MKKLFKSFILASFFIGVFSMSYAAVPIDNIPSISVQGNSNIEVQPDQANISVEISSNDAISATKALEKTELSFNLIVKKLKEINFKDEEIIADSLRTSKLYNYDYKPAKIIGYNALRRLNIIVNDISMIEKVANIILADQTNATIDYISFTVKDKSKYADLAKKKAVEDSIEQAKQLAELYNAKLIKVLKINYNQDYDLINTTSIGHRGEGRKYLSNDSFSDQENYFSPKKIKISDSVDVVFEIEAQPIK